MSDIDRVLAALERVKSIGHNKWNSLCPAHDDKNPSLSISLKNDRVLLKCWSGCGGVQIMESLNIPMHCFAPEGVLDRTDSRVESVFGPRPKRETSLDEYRLAIAKSDRAAGKKLTAAEKEWELQAYLREKRRSS